jgi:Na+/phosphate symporter
MAEILILAFWCGVMLIGMLMLTAGLQMLFGRDQR